LPDRAELTSPAPGPKLRRNQKGVNLRRPISSKAPRALFAVAATATMLVAFGAAGGIGYTGGSVAAAQYQYGKVTLCHVTGSHRVTITVAAAAVPAHLAHGDTRGACR
jgi:hypothetical protein